MVVFKRVPLLLAIVLISCSNASAQKCKYISEEIDAFTGEIVKANAIMLNPIFGSKGMWNLFLKRKGEDFFIEIYLKINDDLNTNLNKGDSIMFKLSNDEIVTCYADEKFSPVNQVVNSSESSKIITKYKPTYKISYENLKLFEKLSVTAIRMNVSEIIYQKELKEKKSKILMHNAICIMK